MKEAILYEQLEENKVKCTACRRYCTMRPGQVGFCGVRKNIDGKLFLLVYGIPMSVNIDPIEKKPIMHRYPNYDIYSLGTSGCDFACVYCQNWMMSQRREVVGIKMSPEEIVENALQYGCKGIAYTYNEPTIFIEYARDIGLIAKKHGLINIFVTNGYESEEAVNLASDFLDIATIGLKGNANNEFYRRYISVVGADEIFDTMKMMNDIGIYTEVTDLVIPEIGDDLEDARKMVRKIKSILGEDASISFLRFFPDYKLLNLPPTPVKTLEEHYRVAKEEGMNYVYIGNVPNHPLQSTYCPNCGSMAIERNMMFSILRNIDKNGACTSCGYQLSIKLEKGESAASNRR